MSELPLLDHLSFPDDLKRLSLNELCTLADEVRERLLDIGDKCGGHLASNLGVVELTIALHTVFDSPNDKFVWDTSHQCYVHKMLTGRLDRMYTIRQDGGLSGFAKITESVHDSFGAGHASTALSAALGYSEARDLQGQNHRVVAIVGDASLSGGMCFEAINNIKRADANFICILNDNNMAISKPAGNMANILTQIRTNPAFTQFKQKIKEVLNHIPKIGGPVKRVMEKSVDRLRDFIIDVKEGVIFEEFGFKYLGPLDGHNITHVMAALKFARSYNGPIMIHLVTTKGKGHLPAEQDPITYHGVKPATSVKTVPVAPVKKVKTFSQVFGDAVIAVAQKDPKVVVITPAMEGGSGLTPYAQTFPDRYYDVGIAEEHAVTFCAGLALGGIKPILAIYSTFLQRGFDQLIHDVCLQELPVVFCLDRAGLAGEDGPTHHGSYDLAYMLPIPNLMILAPKDGAELTDMLHWAVQQPIAVSIRYPKGNVPLQDGDQSLPITQPKAQVLFESHVDGPFDILIIAVGPSAWQAKEAADVLIEDGIRMAVINLRFIKPLDIDTIDPYIARSKQVVVIEDGAQIGGVLYYILQQTRVRDKALNCWHHIGIPDHFPDHGTMKTLYREYGLDGDGIVARLKVILDCKAKKLTVF